MVSPLNIPGPHPAAGPLQSPRSPPAGAVTRHSAAAPKPASAQSSDNRARIANDESGFAAKLDAISAASARHERAEGKSQGSTPAAQNKAVAVPRNTAATGSADGQTTAASATSARAAHEDANASGTAKMSPDDAAIDASLAQPGVPSDDSACDDAEQSAQLTGTSAELSAAAAIPTTDTVARLTATDFGTSDASSSSPEKTKRSDLDDPGVRDAMISMVQGDPSLQMQSAGDGASSGVASSQAGASQDGQVFSDGSPPIGRGALDSDNRAATDRPVSLEHTIVSAPGGIGSSMQPPTADSSSIAGTGAATSLSDTGNSAVAVDQLRDYLAAPLVRLMSSSQRDMVIRLHPAELGELTVRVAVAGRNVSAWFETPQPQVQQALSQAINQLQSELGGAGYNLTGAWVGTGSGGSGEPGSRTPMPMPLRIAESQARSGPVDDGPRAGATSGVSIYV